jgi:glucose/arabinose dehydrogenase
VKIKGAVSSAILCALLLFQNTSTAETMTLKDGNFAVIHQGQDVIWGFEFIDSQSVLFTERSGSLRLLDLKAKKSTKVDIDLAISAEGQGGLLDIRKHPDFANNKWVYLTYSQKKAGQSTTALARFELKDGKAENLKTIFSANALSSNTIHYGSRIAFADDKTLFMSVGDRDERKKAQRLDAHNGKILRLTAEGQAAHGNPFAKTKDALPEIWSYGHRNPQGLAYDSAEKILYEAEFGPRGGDELNKIEPGKNYGWPEYTFGREYWGPKIGKGTEAKEIEAPLLNWVPSISPSGIAFVEADAKSKTSAVIYLSCLSGQHIRKAKKEAAGWVDSYERLLENAGLRFRDIRKGPDGKIYFSTDDGKIGRLE